MFVYLGILLHYDECNIQQSEKIMWGENGSIRIPKDISKGQKIQNSGYYASKS
jgi:hypothetical protein